MTPNITILVGARAQINLAREGASVVAHELRARGHRVATVLVDGDRWDRDLFAPRGEARSDFVFIQVHDDIGKGPIQGYLDLLDVPYDGSGQLASLISDDKHATKSRLSAAGVPVAEGVLHRARAPIPEPELLERVGLPCFVKPNRGGSAIGGTWVRSAAALGPALTEALRWDDAALVERFIPGREVTCGVVALRGEVVALPLTEYLLEGGCKSWELNQGTVPKQTPAALSEALTTEIQRLAKRAYRELDCRGLVRIDFRLDEGRGHAPHLLEVNTLPGLERRGAMLTQVVAAGLDVGEVLETLMLDTLAEREARRRPGTG